MKDDELSVSSLILRLRIITYISWSGVIISTLAAIYIFYQDINGEPVNVKIVIITLFIALVISYGGKIYGEMLAKKARRKLNATEISIPDE